MGRKRLIILIITLTSIMPAFAGPFSDVPEEHWIYYSLDKLQEKGLLEGYPDGYFNGDRPLSRYEMAMALARTVAGIEQLTLSIPSKPDMSSYLSKEDITAINNLISEFNQELEAIGLRITKIEDSLETLTERVKEIEAVTIKGKYSTLAVSTGYYPDSLNNSGFGTPVEPGTGPGPAVIPDRDRYKSPPGSSQLFEGSAIMNMMELGFNVNLPSGFKVGGDFTLYSAFGEKGIIDQWGLKPPYDPMGQIIHNSNFQSHMTSLWFNTDGNWDFTCQAGDYKLKNVSDCLFSGLGTSVMPFNGINFSGTLYEKLDLEVFLARNINGFDKGNGTGIPSEFRYLLAVPYNDGAGAIRIKEYGIPDPGQYDNFLQGLWLGYDFAGGRGHLEGAFLKLYENYASNPLLGIDENLDAPPKDSLYYGLKGHYKFKGDKITLYSEFNQTCFDYNLLDNKDGFTGSYLNGGVALKLIPFRFYGEFIRVDPNYDPLAYHRHWEILYTDNGEHHKGWGWKYGLFACNGRRFSPTQPNRTGIDAGLNWQFGKYYDGTLYFDFTYLEQVSPTMIREDEYSFQRFDFLTGMPLYDSTGVNIYGNQDYFFTENDPAKGRELKLETGGKYRIGSFYTWGNFEYHNFNRNYKMRDYDLDITYCFGNLGLTYDLTDKLAIQGYVEYVKCSGLNETGENVKWSQVIPGFGVKYDFSENMQFLIDYKLYNYNSEYPFDIYDSVPHSLNNDYRAGQLITRFTVSF